MADDQEPARDPPIHVDWVDQPLVGDDLPGRLGVTILPGKRGKSIRYPGLVYRRDARTDLDRLRRLGVGLLVLLVEDHELERWGDPQLEDHAAAAGLRVRRLPIPDGAAPPSVTAVDRLLAEMTAARATEDVVIACMGGVGRSGTIAACALVAAGQTPDGAIAHLRVVRHPTAVETREQVAFVATYAQHVENR
ncbi:MAG TPA: protein-tyrosine phosphatase family protein [Candidatus Limnocylindria bacterium]|jgi:protein-tyrosine phosphatase|nr:protein-tyrosine phosphatase family protein [Candidatus Limnocylindria bacterium]